MDGEAEWYMIDSKEDFKFYLGILSPDLKDARTDFLVEVNDELVLNGTDFSWTGFHEEFVGDNYLKGSEYEKETETDF